jgi:hypothetical protein
MAQLRRHRQEVIYTNGGKEMKNTQEKKSDLF